MPASIVEDSDMIAGLYTITWRSARQARANIAARIVAARRAAFEGHSESRETVFAGKRVTSRWSAVTVQHDIRPEIKSIRGRYPSLPFRPCQRVPNLDRKNVGSQEFM